MKRTYRNNDKKKKMPEISHRWEKELKGDQANDETIIYAKNR